MKYSVELKIAKEAAYKAGDYLLSQEKGIVESAIGKDIKLVNDKQSESIIIDKISETGIPILSEERGLIASGDSTGKGPIWVVDPLDGSANYMKGVRDLTCVSIALWEDGNPILGVINRYERNEIFSGIVGENAFLNNDVIRTSDVDKMQNAVLATGFPVKRSYSEDNLDKFIKSVQRFKKIRMLGAAALMGAFVACGRVDAYTEEDIMLWDIAAATAIVLAAGGYVNVIESTDNKCLCELFANERLYAQYKLR